jgi:hypothetical protein
MHFSVKLNNLWFSVKIQIFLFNSYINCTNCFTKSSGSFSFLKYIYSIFLPFILFTDLLQFHSNITNIYLVPAPSVLTFLCTFILFYYHSNFLGSFLLFFYPLKLITGFAVLVNFKLKFITPVGTPSILLYLIIETILSISHNILYYLYCFFYTGFYKLFVPHDRWERTQYVHFFFWEKTIGNIWFSALWRIF